MTGNAVSVLNGIAVPRNMRYDVIREERTRSGVNAAFDWHPSDTVKLGVDAMYSQYKIDRDALCPHRSDLGSALRSSGQD